MDSWIQTAPIASFTSIFKSNNPETVEWQCHTDYGGETTQMNTWLCSLNYCIVIYIYINMNKLINAGAAQQSILAPPYNTTSNTRMHYLPKHKHNPYLHHVVTISSVIFLFYCFDISSDEPWCGVLIKAHIIRTAHYSFYLYIQSDE